MFRLIIMLLLIVGCATTGVKQNTYPNVAPELKPYIVRFNQYYKQYRHSSLENDIVVKLTTIPQSKTAQGVYYRIEDYTIISSDYWDRLSPFQKEIVVFHELGHHVLKRGHDWTKNNILKNKCSRSMMYYQGVSDNCYSKRRKYYLDELFKWSN